MGYTAFHFLRPVCLPSPFDLERLSPSSLSPFLLALPFLPSSPLRRHLASLGWRVSEPWAKSIWRLMACFTANIRGTQSANHVTAARRDPRWASPSELKSPLTFQPLFTLARRGWRATPRDLPLSGACHYGFPMVRPFSNLSFKSEGGFFFKPSHHHPNMLRKVRLSLPDPQPHPHPTMVAGFKQERNTYEVINHLLTTELTEWLRLARSLCVRHENWISWRVIGSWMC